MHTGINVSIEVWVPTQERGNQLIPSGKAKLREEYVSAITVIDQDDYLVIHSGKRHKVLKTADMEKFEGERAQCGHRCRRVSV